MKEHTKIEQLLELIAVSGEYPLPLASQILTESYRKKIIWKLKGDNLIKIHHKDKLRGYRLTTIAKKKLLEANERRFQFYLTGQSETNRPRSTVPRRLRLHHTAEINTLLYKMKIPFFRDEKPPIFESEHFQCNGSFFTPVFYHAGEVKKLGMETTRIRSSRNLGVLFAEDRIYLLYHTGNGLMKWEQQTEERVKTFFQHQMNLGILKYYYTPNTPIHAVMFGNGMENAELLYANDKKGYFKLDSSFDGIHFITGDSAGKTLFELFTSTEKRENLHALLCSDLQEPGKFSFDHDAVDNGIPVLFAYDFDLLRIARYISSIRIQNLTGSLICFDFQKEVLHKICGNKVEIKTIDLEKFKRRFFTEETI